MTGTLAGIRILDLTTSMSGAIATMLLADQGAEVIKLEPPEGDPTRSESGAQVWMRSKRSAIVRLPEEAELVTELAKTADVLIDSWTPAQRIAHGLDDDRLASANPRLLRCSVTGYGPATRDSERPADPHLVAARTGLLWEQRGWPGGAINRVSGAPPNALDLETPEGCWDGDNREGPVFAYTPHGAIAAAHITAIAIVAALHSRERTGRGQRVETSLWQATLAQTWISWQRAEHPDAFNYDSWVPDSRSTKGMFECADGRWVCHWVPRPTFVFGVSEGDALDLNAQIPDVHHDDQRLMPDTPDLVILHLHYPEMAKAFSRFTAREWEEVAAAKAEALQPVRTPEEALADPALLADGSIIEVVDPTLGAVRQAGLGFVCSETQPEPPTAPVILGADSEWVRELARSSAGLSTATGNGPDPVRRSPLDGITVLDLGLAVAGPWGTQVLSDLGARVIKVNREGDNYSLSSHIGMACNRGKESIAIDLKKPDAIRILHQLVQQADVVQHNMRYSAAERLGVDYESLRKVNPQLIYCHTTGFDESRDHLPGNDQTGAALAGTLYEDGGCADGGRPMWSLTALGDTGNGYLSAFAILSALLHRDRTGEGQFVTTSIVRAHLLDTTYAWLDGEGNPAPRPHLDRQQFGIGPLQRLYETSDGWLCLAVRSDADREAFLKVVGLPDINVDSVDAAEIIATELRHRSAAEWSAEFDAAGVPAEVCADTGPGVFDDQELSALGWTTHYDHPHVGRLDMFGKIFDFSETPARIAGPPPMAGQHTRTILDEFGYSRDQIEDLIQRGAAYAPE
ncbi:hypothetical protein A5761_09940 [Mycolicibacterium setense]|uniref:CoA transferase n=1 Tax=Mycolicibacterium setense TaxID=431269 RepID=UPI0007EA5BA7|nr:CoA transferase [Mycolicibacterium setense]OBB17666.1 hypothetical protein A5761_09940 [Mycolicibacterium setense]